MINKIKNYLFTVLSLLILLFFVGCSSKNKNTDVDNEPTPKIRVIHTSDLVRDDENTLVRMLLFANDQNIVGITSSASPWSGKGIIHKVYDKIDLYEKVYENLKLHDPSYPSPDYLRSITKAGNETATDYMEDTPGSMLIKDVLLDHSDDSPVWVTCWGAPGTVTAALRYINDNHPEEKEYVAHKLKIFFVGDQEGTEKTYGTGIHPLLDYINSNYKPAPLMLSGMAYQYMNYWGSPKNWCDNYTYSTKEWVNKNYNKNHGALCSAFVYYDSHDCDGDAMALLHLLGSSYGLRSTEHPSYGGWGTRFTKNPNEMNLYRDDAEECNDHYQGKFYVDTWTQRFAYSGARWADDFQTELAVRADWCVKPYAEANHPPKVTLNVDKDKVAKPGEVINLSCSATDPDGDSLKYHWWQYKKAGTSKTEIEINNANKSNASFICPEGSEGTIHIILEVQDNGKDHPLTRYARVIVTVESSK